MRNTILSAIATFLILSCQSVFAQKWADDIDLQQKNLNYLQGQIFASNERILAPLKSQVFEFFRGYRLTVVIEDYLDDYEVKIVEWTLSDDRITHEFPNRFDSWGDAESASIDKLIELVKKK